jgi:hypothetical protein
MKYFTLVLGGVIFSQTLLAFKGFFTPDTLKMTITKIELSKVAGGLETILSTNTDITFAKTDTDYSATALGNVTIPEGRYTGASVSYTNTKTLTINGAVYQGQTAGSIVTGDTIYGASTGTDMQEADPGQVHTITFTSNSTGASSTSLFNGVVCIAATSTSSTCESTDTIITTPSINMVADLYHAGTAAEPTTSGYDMGIGDYGFYPILLLDDPGASIHLNYSSGGFVANISLIFNKNAELIYAHGNRGQEGSVAGFCPGGWVAADNTVSADRGQAVMVFGGLTGSDAGKVQYAGHRESDGSWYPGGINVLDNVLQAVGSNVSVSCVVPASATPANLGFSFDGISDFTGNSGSTNFTIKRISDPNGVLTSAGAPICATSPCGSY